MNVNVDELMAVFEEACKDLLFMSESDYELKPFYWKETASRQIEEATILELSGLPLESNIETESIDDLFRNAIRDQNWHGPKQKNEVERYRELVKLLKENLRNPVVFRIGKVEIDVFLVGRLRTGDLAGVSTKVIET